MVPQNFLLRANPLEVFRAWARGGSDLNRIGKLVPAIVLIERNDLTGISKCTVETDPGNLYPDVGV